MLVPCVVISESNESPDPVFDSVMIDLNLFAERLTIGSAADSYSFDRNSSDRLFDISVAHLQRASITSVVRVSEHNCPHKLGFDESVFIGCNNIQYNYKEVII